MFFKQVTLGRFFLQVSGVWRCWSFGIDLDWPTSDWIEAGVSIGPLWLGVQYEFYRGRHKE